MEAALGQKESWKTHIRFCIGNDLIPSITLKVFNLPSTKRVCKTTNP